jgi:hypothetical protein
MTLAAGTLIGRYEIRSPRDRRVYLAQDTELETHCQIGLLQDRSRKRLGVPCFEACSATSASYTS